MCIRDRYIHFREFLLRNGILPGATFTLRPSLALSYFGNVTARHSSSGRRPNFAALNRGRHLYSAGRLSSRWALAHILVSFFSSTDFSTPLNCFSRNFATWCSVFWNWLCPMSLIACVKIWREKTPNFRQFADPTLWAAPFHNRGRLGNLKIR